MRRRRSRVHDSGWGSCWVQCSRARVSGDGRKVVEALGPASKQRGAWTWWLRFAVLIGIAYVIVKYLEVTPVAVFLGLLVSAAAVIVCNDLRTYRYMEHELWLTALLNRFAGGPANAVLDAVQSRRTIPRIRGATGSPMELLVVAIIIVVFAILRSRLSVDKPGKLPAHLRSDLRIRARVRRTMRSSTAAASTFLSSERYSSSFCS